MRKVLLTFFGLLIIQGLFAQLPLTQGTTQVHDGVTQTSARFICSFDFGQVAVGSSKDLTFIVTNNYNSTDYTWHPSTIDGPFTFVTEPTGILSSSGGTTSFTVRFSPTSTSGNTGLSRITTYFLQPVIWEINFSGTGVGSNTAPAISGTAPNQAVNDSNTLGPFSGVSVTDADGDNVSATITLDAAAKGVLTGTGLSDDGGGVYSIASTTVSDLQSKLQALVFNPTDNRSATSETTAFTLAVNDGTDTSSDNTTTVVSSAVAPVVSSITLSGSPTANATNIDFTVTF
ncbi:MAG: hypothetical protein HEP71_29685, partial [Roseivirga sp.]|nr:hypothetical protein [Roseivirga sp.]